MKIAIDLTSLSYHMTGIERYALYITRELLINDKNNNYILVFRNEIFSDLIPYIVEGKDSTIVLKGDNKFWFYQYTLMRCMNSIKADKYLFLAFVAPFFFRKRGTYSAIHDMVMWDFPQTLTLPKKIYAKLCCFFTVHHAEGIITVSNFSKNRLAEILKVDPQRVYVVYSAVSSKFCERNLDYDTVSKKYNLPPKYILTLSTLEPRKNMKLLLDAFSKISDQVNYDLVLVGRTGWKVQELLNMYTKHDRIHIAGFVEDDDIPEIYANAMCFIFPTLYEGFGLPPVEALSMGTPVISSDAASMPEILREQAIYFKSQNQEELQSLLQNLEKNASRMPHELDDYQKENYRFDVSAKKILSLLESGEL